MNCSIVFYFHEFLGVSHRWGDVGQIRDLSMFSCGGFRVRKEEELERSYNCLGVV